MRHSLAILLCMIFSIMPKSMDGENVSLNLHMADGAAIVLKVSDGLKISFNDGFFDVASDTTPYRCMIEDVKSFDYDMETAISSDTAYRATYTLCIDNSTVTISGCGADSHYSISDMNGRVIAQEQFSESANIRMDDLPAGVYVIAVNNRSTFKIAVK